MQRAVQTMRGDQATGEDFGAAPARGNSGSGVGEWIVLKSSREEKKGARADDGVAVDEKVGIGFRPECMDEMIPGIGLVAVLNGEDGERYPASRGKFGDQARSGVGRAIDHHGHVSPPVSAGDLDPLEASPDRSFLVLCEDGDAPVEDVHFRSDPS